MLNKVQRCAVSVVFGVALGLGSHGCSRLYAEGWTNSGNIFTAAFSSAPATALKLTLDLGAVSTLEQATIEARVENTGTSTIAYGSVVQESGLVDVCPCEAGALSLGSLAPGECLRIKTRPVRTAGGTQNVAFRLEGFVEISISATLPNSVPTASGGLNITTNCGD